MAARGRFGRSDTGTSNLSSMIRSLVAQQQAQEESALMNAFYGGLQYNGSVPTMADVQAFYSKYVNITGIEKGSPEWNLVQQKVEGANNYDIRSQYKELISTFQSTNGSNFGELLSFLKGRATQSTDPQDSVTYQSAIGDSIQAYIRYRGDALTRGEITAAEYRQMTSDLVSQMDPNDPKRYATLVDSYTYEWNAEKSKWDNRLVAGKVSVAQYNAWAKSFGKSLIEAGVSKDSEIYTATLAAIARASGSSGGAGSPNSTTSKRLAQTSADLGELFTTGAVALGLNVGNKTLADIVDMSQGGSLKDIMSNPEVLSGFAAFLDENPSYTNPVLTRLGITSGDDLRTWVDNAVKSGYADATAIAVAGGRDHTETWYGISVTNGAMTGIDEFAASSLKWMKDKQNAQGNDVLLSYYNNEWKKFLSGDPAQPSIYGMRPSNFGTEAFLSLYMAEVDAANGKFTAETSTLSGMVDANADKDWKNFAATDNNAATLLQGGGVLKWDPNSESYAFAPKQVNGVLGGNYQYTEFQRINGKVIAYVVSIPGQQIIKQVNNKSVVDGFVYLLPSGKTVITNTKGVEIVGADLRQNGDKWEIGPNGSGVDTGRGPKTVNLDPLIVRGPDVSRIDFNPSDPEARRALAMSQGVDAETLRAAADAALVVAGALDPLSRQTLDADISGILGTAKQQDLFVAMNAPDANTPDGQLRIELINSDGNVTERSKALQYVINNPDKVTEVAPNYYISKAGPERYGTGDFAGSLGQAAAATPGVLIGAAIGAPLGPIGIGLGAAIGALAGLPGGTSGMPGVGQVYDTRTPEQKAADYAAGAATPQAQQYASTGYSGGADTFFRNLSTTSKTTAPAVSPYLAMQATAPVVSTPKAPATPKPAVLPAFDPNDPEARRALVLKPVTAPVISSGPRAGQPMGGGL